MIKLWMDRDEYWPFHTLTADKINPSGHPSVPRDVVVELSDEEYADYRRVMQEFERWQMRIEDEWYKRGGE